MLWLGVLSEGSDAGSLHIYLSWITHGFEFLSTLQVNCLIRSPLRFESILLADEGNI